MSFVKEDFHFNPATPFALFETNASQVMIHCHDCLEINYITAGNGHYIIEDNTYPINQGDLFIINNAEHHMAVHDGTLSMIVFVFDPHFIWETASEYDYLGPFFTQNTAFMNRICPEHTVYKKCSSIFKQIASEHTRQDAGWQLLIKALLMLFLAYLNRSCLMDSDGHSVSYQRNNSYDKIRPVIEYIHNHYQEAVSLDELAQVALMNKSYLSSYFTKVMKIRIFEYIEQVRISQSKLLLRTTSQPITEIAFSCGFNNSSYFNRMFKKITGTTPLRYRTNSKNSSIFTE